MTTPALALDRIGQIALNADDIPAATAFYRGILGLKFLFGFEDQMAFFDCGGVRLMISQPENAETKPHASILYFPVGDIDAGHQALIDAGVTIEDAPKMIAKMPDHKLWMCFFRDPAGNLLALMCEKR